MDFNDTPESAARLARLLADDKAQADALKRIQLLAYSIKLKTEELDLLRDERADLFLELRNYDVPYSAIAANAELTVKRIYEICASRELKLSRLRPPVAG